MGKVQGKIYRRNSNQRRKGRVEDLEECGRKKASQLRRKYRNQVSFDDEEEMGLLSPMDGSGDSLEREFPDVLRRPSSKGNNGERRERTYSEFVAENWED